MSGWYIPQDLFRSLSQSQLSKKQGKMNGMLNNSAIGQKKGKLLMKKDLGAVPKNIGHNVSPEPSVTREHNYDGVVPKNTGDTLSTKPKAAYKTINALSEHLGTKPVDTSVYGAADAVSEKIGTTPVDTSATETKKPTLWGAFKQGMSGVREKMSKLPPPVNLTVQNIMKK